MTAALTSAGADRPPVVVRPAPRREPPFDDEIPPGLLHLVGPLDQQLPFPPDPLLIAPVPRRTPPDRGPLPDPAAWARRFLIGVLEAVAGRRPVSQLAPHLSPGVRARLSQDTKRAMRARHWHEHTLVRTVRACEPCRGVAEIGAVVQTGDRCRAVALRLEEHHGRWRCALIHLG